MRKMEEVWKEAISGEKKPCLGFFRFFLHLISFPYLLAFLIFRKMQSLRQVKLPCPVISVGNITLGGTGKTALTLLLAKKLEAMGYKVAILCTGYGGKREGKVEEESPEEVGDEAFLLAKGIEKGGVWAGRDRLRMAREALREGVEVVIMDDAMQYFRIKKDLEIAMLNALSPFGYGYIFPRGTLREPLSALKRADVIILNNSDLILDKFRIFQRIAEVSPTSTLLEANYLPVELLALPEGKEVPLEWLRGKRIMGIAGIGSPEGFRKTLEKLTGEVVFRPFPDHHRFEKEELLSLQEEARGRGCDALVVTGKDGVKINELLRRDFPLLLPFFVLDVELRIFPEEELWRRIRAILKPKPQG